MVYVWKDNVVEALQYAADKEFQKNCLLNPAGPFMWIPIEDKYDIFEDTGLLEALNAGQEVFGQESDNILRELYLAMQKLDYRLSAEKIFVLPEMQIVREKAALALSYIERGM